MSQTLTRAELLCAAERARVYPAGHGYCFFSSVTGGSYESAAANLAQRLAKPEHG
jgi:hypothetical protein